MGKDKRNWEYNRVVRSENEMAHIESEGKLLTITLGSERGIFPAIHSLDWIYGNDVYNEPMDTLRVVREIDLERKNIGIIPFIDYHARGGYNSILVPEGGRARIEDVLMKYFELLRTAGRNLVANLLIKEVPPTEMDRILDLANKNSTNAVVADGGSFVCLRGESFKGGLQELISRRREKGYRFADVDTVFYF